MNYIKSAFLLASSFVLCDSTMLVASLPYAGGSICQPVVSASTPIYSSGAQKVAVVTHDDHTYTIHNNDGMYAVFAKANQSTNSGSTVDIPSFIKFQGGCIPVIAIGVDAFATRTIGGVVIPFSVKVIEERAFFYATAGYVLFSSCSQLKQIYPHAFFNSSIQNITIPSSVSFIGKYAFANDDLPIITRRSRPTISSIVFEEDSQLEEIGEGAFEYADITSITIPPLVEFIPDFCFHCCHNLTNVIIPQNSDLSEFGDSAFAGDVNLVSISNLEKIETLGEDSLSACKQLQIPEGWQPFAKPNAFRGVRY